MPDYAREVVTSLDTASNQLLKTPLHDRVAIICPDGNFVENLRDPLKKELKRRFAKIPYELVTAEKASAYLPRKADENATKWILYDSIENMDGLERLVVICVGLDQSIKEYSEDAKTRSKLYRAMTRSQLAVAIVNKAIQGGWLEWLGLLRVYRTDNVDDGDVKQTSAADKILEREDQTVKEKKESHEVRKTDKSVKETVVTAAKDDQGDEPDLIDDDSDDDDDELQIKQNIFEPTLVEQKRPENYVPKFMPFKGWYIQWRDSVFENVKECFAGGASSVYVVAIRDNSGNHFTLMEWSRLHEDLEIMVDENVDTSSDNLGFKRFSFMNLELEIEAFQENNKMIIASCMPNHTVEVDRIIEGKDNIIRTVVPDENVAQ